jgi:hypothetical protein
MIKVVSIDYAGGACPYQLEGKTEDGKWFYLRYRGGWLRYVVAETHTTWMKSKKDSWYNYSKQIGDEYDGGADHEKFMTELDGRVQFPEGFKFESFPDKE